MIINQMSEEIQQLIEAEVKGYQDQMSNYIESEIIPIILDAPIESISFDLD